MAAMPWWLVAALALCLFFVLLPIGLRVYEWYWRLIMGVELLPRVP